MADSENDSLSVEDLLAAFGAPSPRSVSEPDKPKKPKKSESSTAAKRQDDALLMNEEEMDLLSALGITASGVKAAPPAPRSETGYNRSERDSFKDAARKEQQIRAQQWQQELRRREARIARMQTAAEEDSADRSALGSQASPVSTPRQGLPFTEEGGLSKKPSLPEFEDGGLEADQGFAGRRIPEPSFLSSKQPSFRDSQVAQGAQSDAGSQFPPSQQPQQMPQSSQVVQPSQWAPQQGYQAQQMQYGNQPQPVQSQPQPQPQPQAQPLPASGLPSFGSSGSTEFKGFKRRVIEPLGVSNAEQAKDSGQALEAQYETSAVEDTYVGEQLGLVSDGSIADADSQKDISSTASGSAIAPSSSQPIPGDGVIRRSFFPTAAPLSSIQRLDEAQQPQSTADQDSFVERRQIPLSDSTDALSTGVLNSIQPVPGAASSEVAPQFAEADAKISAQASEQDVFGMVVSEQVSSGDGMLEQQRFESAQFEAIHPQDTSMPSVDQAQMSEAFPAAPVAPMQPGSPVPMGQPDINTASFGQMSDPTGVNLVDQFGNPVVQDPMIVSQPMPQVNPVAPISMGMPIQDDQFDIQKQDASSRRNNILGIILIIVALLCAAMAIGMLSGLFNMNTTSNTSSSTSASSSAQISDVASDPNTTQAIYTYVVRGVDGTTHEATETATFNADGFLEGSTIELQVENADVANALLEQLKSEFGTSVVNSEADETHVRIDLDINRDDLTKDAYTELLLANMTEFKQVS